MPNYGRSGRCRTCKRRRVKCDEARPACSPCCRLGLECGGYARDYAFRDESHRFCEGKKKTTLKEDEHEQASALLVRRKRGKRAREEQHQQPSRSLLTAADVAVPFFLVHYAGVGRSLAVARGFYETLIPIMSASHPPDAPLSLAVSAVALRVFSLWRGHENAIQAEPRHLAPYTQAVASLRAVLQRPDDRRRPATALAVLALHLYESISAVYDARAAAAVHHHGALSLLRQIEALDSRGGLDGLVGTYVKGFVLHTEISAALRQKRPLHPDVSSYVKTTTTTSLVPANLSSALDEIGASVAELQADYVRHRHHHAASSGSLLLEQQRCRGWITEAGRLDERLQAWARDMPVRWRPVRLTQGLDFCASIPAYRSACDIYPSCQMATLWNLWRFHRLLLLKITVGATQAQSQTQGEVAGCCSSSSSSSMIQDLVDGICHSVPFYLGNRTAPSRLSDFTDQAILFPSYHALAPGDARLVHHHDSSGGNDGDDVDDAANAVAPLSRDEHHRHIVAYGAWHVVSPLSNLLTTLLAADDDDDHGGGGGARRWVANCLRPGQQDWIREQFLRVSILVRLPRTAAAVGHQPLNPSPLPGGLGPDPDPKSSAPCGSEAESLARQVRRGARFMSGP